MVDTPWNESGGGRIKRGCDRYYKPIKTIPKILSVILTSGVWDEIADDAHMYFWVTNNYESWAHQIIPALGFRHLVSLPWLKPGNAGLGQYFRGKNETLMFCVRGSGYAVKTATKSLCTDHLVGAPRPLNDRGRVIHSAKPLRSYELVEERTTGRLLEMFARSNKPKRDRWELWGDQLTVAAETPTGPAKASA